MTEVRFLPPAAKFIKKLKDKKLKTLYQEAIDKIREDHLVGTQKTGDLAGIYGYDIYYNKTNYELTYKVEYSDDKIIIVIMAGTRESFYNELKNYPTSITRECMKYQNHVANAIKPRIFETPFIGSNAIKVQLEQAKQRKAQLKELLQKLEEQIKEIEHIKKSLDTTYDIDIQYRVDILPDMQSLAEEIDKCNKNIATLEKNSNMLQKQIQLSTLEDMIRELEQQLLKNNQCVGRIEEKIQNANAEILEHSAELVKKKAGYVEQLANAGDDGTAWEKEYDKQTSDKSFVQFYFSTSFLIP